MSNIYQLIWNADQSTSGNGIKPMLDTEQGDPNVGYVKVNSNLDSNDPNLRVLTEVVIPERKKTTYDLCRKLFDNYALMESEEEDDIRQEWREVSLLIDAMIKTPPMEVAREFLAYDRERMRQTIMQLWFARFSQGGDPHLTGFEHVVVGEGQGKIVQGYHFWYRYYLDDGFARENDGAYSFPGLDNDRITYVCSKQSDVQGMFPESVTIKYKWNAPDYSKGEMRELEKSPCGGFFVGCSVEGLLAIGTVRALGGSKRASIEGARYNLVMWKSHDNLHVRTFYPKFLTGLRPVTGKVRIIAALVNPKGHDPGSETVTLINLGSDAQNLNGWQIRDKNFNSESLNGKVIGGGDTLRITLTGSDAQLANKGGTIELVDSSGDQEVVVHSVTYPRSEAQIQGETLFFGDT